MVKNYLLKLLITLSFFSIAYPACASAGLVINSVSPQAITPGDTIIIEGNNFGDKKGNIYLNNIKYPYYGYSIESWTDNKIIVNTSEHDKLIAGKIGIQKWNNDADKLEEITYDSNFYIQPKIYNLSSLSGQSGEKIFIQGAGFINNYGLSIKTNPEVYFGDNMADILNYNATNIEVVIPKQAEDGTIKLIIKTNNLEFPELKTFGPDFNIVKKVNDSLIEDQYYLKNAEIEKAWDYSQGSSEVVVAVIDDGIYLDHPDLKNNIWTNTKEIKNNNKDDDNNGHIDDYQGWNFVEDSNEMKIYGTHGTMIAGIIGADENNQFKIKGINKQIKLMPIVASDSNGYADLDNIISSIDYAVNNGAQIINLSLGSNFALYIKEFDSIIKYANEKNVLIVAAGGNGDIYTGEGVNLTAEKMSPVCNDLEENMILGVGAIGKDNKKTSWSNFGSCIDIYAPGVDITSTTAPLYSSTNGFYDSFSGTSFSAPIVAGTAALIKAKYPQISNTATRNRIIFNTTQKNGLKILNAYQAIIQPFSDNETTFKDKKDKAETHNTISDDYEKIKNVVNEERRLVVQADKSFSDKLKGYILLQVEKDGQAWYVFPDNQKRYYLGRPEDAFKVMQKLGLGVKHDFIVKNNIYPEHLLGKILIDVEEDGRAYYIYPKDRKAHYLGSPADAFRVMKELNRGILNKDIRKINIGEIL